MSLIIRGKENNKILSLPSEVDIGPVIFFIFRCLEGKKVIYNQLPAFCKIIFVNGEQKTEIKIKTSHCNRKFHEQTTF